MDLGRIGHTLIRVRGLVRVNGLVGLGYWGKWPPEADGSFGPVVPLAP